MQQLNLTTQADWHVKERDPGRPLQEDFRSDEGWVLARVPGSVHEALWTAGRIGTPYAIDEQSRATWIADRDFLYRCRFDVPGSLALASPDALVKLCCDGLDTIATVWVNGHEVLRSDNMFVPHEVPLTSILKPRDNELWILFESALRVGREREARHGQRPVWNGDNSRVYVRKAQYQYGWDFGPTLLGAGPWQPVRIIAYAARIAELKAPLAVAEDLASATLTLDISVERAPAAEDTEPLILEVALHAPGGAVVHTSTHPLVGDTLHHPIELGRPQLWWPHGHGAQPLYQLSVRLIGRTGHALDERRLRLGARRARLVQSPLPDGETFYFEINNRPIFCGGANWIPPDLLPTRITPTRYRRLLTEAVAANMTMLRIWGGGIYESDTFYDLCDELGILVWQDFLFACGLYPGGDGAEHDHFASSVAAEAAAAIRRLRHHPSLVIWAGNNEDYSIAASVRAYQGPEEAAPPPGPSSLKKPIFDGRHLYEGVLARACAEHDPTRPYWPGSPYSRKAIDPSAPTEGDRHIWEIWHFPMLDYQEYGRVGGRFASELGMQAVPDLPTLRVALGPRTIGQGTLVLLNKGQDGPERIGNYIERNLPDPQTLDDYIYATQVIQAEALSYAVRTFRRQFDSGRRCGGVLVWQLDDCWPGVSWSMLAFCDEDEAVRRKPSIYAVRRELRAWAVGLSPVAGGVAAWVVAPPDCGPAVLRLRAFNLDGRLHGTSEQELRLTANAANELGELRFAATDAPLVYGAQVLVGGAVVARTVMWPQPLRKLPLRDPGITAQRDGDDVQLTVQCPAKAVLLSTDALLDWSDNLLDLLPDEPLVVHATGLGSRQLDARSVRGVHPCL